jgi:uncharacterized protein YfaS (alpha-2-macroglobulin family)
MRFILLAISALTLCFATAAAKADDLNIDSNFIDTSNQNPTLCVHFNAALKPGLDAHYEDYVQVDHLSGIVTQVSGNNLCIGGIPYRKHYSVTLLAGLVAQNGDKLPSNATVEFAPGDRPPLVAITGNGLYLAKRSAGGLAITSVNINKLIIHVLRLNDLNAIQDFALNQNGNNSFDPTLQSMPGYTLSSLVASQAGVIWSGTMAVKNEPDTAVQTLFPIATTIGQSPDRMAAKPGVYLVVAEDAANAAPQGFWTSTLSSRDTSTYSYGQNFAAHWVIVTDLGLTTLTGEDGLHVNVRSVSSAAVDHGIRLDLISEGGDVLDSVTTDGTGNAFFPKAMIDGLLANAPLAVAAYGPDGDFAYLPLDRAAFDLSDRGVTGREAPNTNDAFIFSDRGIYRPGETIKAVVLLRDADGNALPGQKLSLGLIRVDSVQVATLPVVTDDAGGAAVSIPLPANALHGRWTIQAFIDPNLPPIGCLIVDVQNFQPADIRVDASGAPRPAAPGANLTLQATGTYLYGAPAASLPVQAKLTITRDNDPIANAAGYSFGLLNDPFADAESDIPNNGADANGKITLHTTIPIPPTTTNPLLARIDIGYVEPSGVVTKTEQTVKLITAPDLIGIKPLFTGGSVNSGAPADFSIAAFDPSTAKPIAASGLVMRIVRTDTVYDWVGSNGSWTWRSYTVDHPVELGKLDLPAGRPTQFTRTLPDGDYTLILADPKTGAATSLAFTVGWAGIGNAAAIPDNLSLTTDHTLLTPGGTAIVKITGPFAGEADIYVANNRIYSQQQIIVPAGGVTTPIKATPDWNGGAYVIADLHRGSADAPAHASFRAIGLGWIGLDPAPHTLGVAIEAPSQILPRTRQVITVKITNSAPGQQVHLVLDAVDEGILGLTNYKTPDPAGWFWGQRKLGVEIRDIFGALLNDQGEAGSIQQGGDEGAGGPRLPMQSTRLFAIATGDLTVGPEGSVQIPLDVPDFEGQARLSAIAWSATAAGSSNTDMIVRDPVVMLPGLPNFLSAGDQADIPITLNNLDGPPGAYSITIKASGLTLKSAAPIQLSLAKTQQTVIRIPITAGPAGIASLHLALTNQTGLKIIREFSFAIRAGHPPAFSSIFGPIKPGAVILLPAEVLKSGATSGYARFAVSSFPGLDPGTLLAALASDTTSTDSVSLASRAFPLLDAATAAQYPGGSATAKTTVTAAITTIINRQNMNGDIGNWSFNDAGGFNDWVTCYALDFLFSAKSAGYDVPKVVIDRSTSWLNSESRNLAQIVTGQNQAYGSEAPAPFASFVYTQLLLARTGQVDISALRVAADALSLGKTPDGKPVVFWGGGNTPGQLASAGDLAKLALALYLAGDSTRASNVLNLSGRIIGAPGQNAWTDGFWWSGNQDTAIFLYAAASMNDHAQFARAVAQLDPASLIYDSDDDAIAWLLRAAQVRDRQAAATEATLKFSFAGKTQHLTSPAASSLNWTDIMKGSHVTILSGTGYYAFSAQYVPAVPANAFAHGMALNVTYQDFSGRPLDLHALHQGQDVAVVISGSVPGNTVHNFGIVALLPGCFNIEKAMPSRAAAPSLVLSQPQSFSTDIDRFLASVQLGTPAWDDNRSDNSSGDTSQGDSDIPRLPHGHFAVAYLAKVTTAGTFTLPEVTVRDRLHPAINAGSGSQSVTVLP